MKKLFLTSSFADVAEYFLPFAGEDCKGKTVTFIPTASEPETYKGYVENDKEAFKRLGIIVDELCISKASREKCMSIIEKNDLIYISGGNTFYLLQELKNSGIDNVLFNEIQRGKLYIGASAGSVILSKNITYIEKMDDSAKAKNLYDRDALDVVDFYILPHHTNEPFKHIVEEILNDYGNKLNLVPISNTEAVQVTGDRREIAGSKN